MNKKDRELRTCISALYRQFQIYINNNTKDLGIGASEYIFLMEMYEKDNISQEELSKSLIVDKAATARAIKSLEEKEYIFRIKDENDKRTNRVKLTKKGIQVQKRLIDLLEQWNIYITQGMETEKLDIVFDTIKQMSSNAIERNKTE